MNHHPLTAVAPAIVAVLVALASPACSSDQDDDQSTKAPLQPLIYTEYPELTSEGAAVRERRLHRQLMEGSTGGDWGRLEKADRTSLPDLDDVDALGEAIVDALLDRDETLWEHVFISPENYAAAADVDSADAAEFVDNQIGESFSVWELFAPDHSSLVAPGGLSELLSYHSLQLGEAEDGGDGGDITRYVDNRLVIAYADGDLRFEFSIPAILKIDNPVLMPADDDAESRFRLGSNIDVDPRFRLFRDVGLHLKPQLLRPEEYPFPMGVGSFWRYRRFDADEGAKDTGDPLDRRLEDTADGVAAEEVLVEVRDISRYGPMRLVELLRSYDDRRHTRVRHWWLLTPRRIYACDQTCRERVEDVDWLLEFFERRAPLFLIPPRLGDRWQREGPQEESTTRFSIDDAWHEVQSPAGTFPRAYRIEGTGDLGRSDRYVEDAQVTRYFVSDRGVVRRIIRDAPEAEEPIDVVEELVEYRLMH